MTAGKTAKLIRLASRFLKKDLKVCVMVSEIYKSRDKFKDGVGDCLQSRNGKSIPINYYISQDDSLMEIPIANVYLVDELHFLSLDQVEQLWRISHRDKVYMFGLRTDFNFNTFPASEKCFRLASKITIMNTLCRKCRNMKSVVDALVKEADIIDGSICVNGRYEQYCYDCMVAAQSNR